MVKRMRTPLLGILTVFMCFALAFGLSLGAARADGDTPAAPVCLSAPADFVIDEQGKLTGLSDAGKAKISDGQYFELIIPANVTQVSTLEFQENNQLVKLSFAEGSNCNSLKMGKRNNLFQSCTSLREVDFTNATKLTAIGNYLFSDCISLSKVTFAESSVNMTIGQRAFANTALTSFEILANVSSIGNDAFYNCAALETLTVAEGHPKYTYYTDASGNRYDQAVYEKDADGNITAYAVAASAMTSLTLPKAVLEVTDIPEEELVEAIANKASALCNALFYISGLETIKIEENDELYAYGNCLFIKEGSKLTSDVLEWSQLANDIFFAPSSVKEITLPAEFTYTPDDVDSDGFHSSYFWYYYFESMEEYVSWANTLKNLESIKVDADNPVYTSFDGSLFKKDYSEFWIPRSAASFTLPAQITELDFTAFSANKLLKEIYVEEGNTAYTSFAGSLFKKDYSECYVPVAATSFTVPKEMNSLDFSTLADNKSLREIIIQEGNPAYVSDNGIIYDKGKTEILFVPSNVTEFYVPATLEKISENAFAVYDGDTRVANKIKNIYVEDLEAWCKIRFGDPIETDEQYETAPDGSLSAERRRAVADGLSNGYGANPMSGGANMYVREDGSWKLLENLVVDYDGALSDLAFAGCKSLRTVTVTNKITGVGEMSFAMCKNIRSISLPFVGCKREYVMIREHNTLCSAYFYEVFGGRGTGGSSGTAMYKLAPEKIDSITVTGYNILKETITDGSRDDDYEDYPVYLVPWFAFSDAPVRKITIAIDKNDGHDLMFGFGLFLDSTVSEVDLENSQVNASGGNVSSGSIISENSLIKEIIVLKTLTKIPTLFFALDENDNVLDKVVIPEGVEYIDHNNFGNLDALTLPTTIGGFWTLYGVKTVYLTGFTPNDKYSIASNLLSDTVYVATDSEVYAKLPEIAKNDSDYPTHPTKKIFYQADVLFLLKNSAGEVIAETTEKHLAARGQFSTPYLKWAQTRGAKGDVYWALDENYALPDAIGNYKADNTKWMLDGVAVTADTCLRGDKAQYVIEQTLPEGSEILLTPVNVTKQYDGNSWQIPEGMEVSSVSVDKGGNGYYYNWSNKSMPSDVGTYSVKAKCKSGYAWYDESASNSERTFTLRITPVSTDAEWFYSIDGVAWQNITNTAPEHMYDGSSVHNKIYAQFTDVFGQKRRVDYTNLTVYASGDGSNPVYSMTDAGTYEVTINDSGKTTDDVAWLGNYTFESRLYFTVTPRVIDLNDYDNLSWGLDAYGSLLRDGDIYMYGGVPYAYVQPTLGAPDSTLHVLDSIVRLRSADNHKIVISNIPVSLGGVGAQYSAVYSGNTADRVGIYTATAVLTVSDANYAFGYGLGSDLTSRGMTIVVNPDGTATVTKKWYVVTIDNGMLNVDGTEYKINGWTFGDDVVIAAPRLEHGDEDESGYLSNGKVRFTLTRNGETIANRFGRNVFGHYINKSMPAGKYELVCEVSDVSVGNHTHWWNNEVHDGADADVLYHGFTRTLVFEITAADIGFTLSAPSDDGYASYEWELNGNKETFFSKFEAAVSAVGKVVLISVDPQGYWSEHKEYYGGYTLSYNFARMSNNTYLTATDGNLHKYIDGGAKGTYNVYFQITAPNHSPLTDMGDGRYSYFFTVIVFETLDPADIHVENVTYTGIKNIPAISEKDVYHVVLDESDGYVDGGEHTLYLVLNDGVHYRWKGVDAGETDLPIKYTIEKALNDWLEAPDIVRWIEGKFDEEENGFIGAAKFGTISYVITDTNDNVIYDLSQGIDNRAGMKAGTYILKATVAGNANYSGLSEAFTIRILEKAGLAWWVTLLIVIGSLGAAALVIFILWKKGVFQIVTEKIVVAIRTRASVDATIAAVRAAKREDEARASVAAAEARERAEERRAAAMAEKEKPAEERAAAMEAKARAQAERAEKMRLRAEALQARAARLRSANAEQTAKPEEEAAATETDGTTSTDE